MRAALGQPRGSYKGFDSPVPARCWPRHSARGGVAGPTVFRVAPLARRPLLGGPTNRRAYRGLQGRTMPTEGINVKYCKKTSYE